MTNWLTETRISYDTVARSYADLVRGRLTDDPRVRSAMAAFAAAARPGRVADVGCGPGVVGGHLREHGLDVLGIDLSPGMIRVAGQENPDIAYVIGSMTALPAADASFGGLVAWYSLIHVPDDEIATVLDEFRRVLRHDAPLLLGFHAGDGVRHLTEGYGGHPMNVRTYRRSPDRLAARLAADHGFAVETVSTNGPAGMVSARRR